MKKNVKKVVKARRDQLFVQFLSGETRDGVVWQKSYLNDPVLGQAASLLVRLLLESGRYSRCLPVSGR